MSAAGQSALSEVDYMMFGCIGLGVSESNVNVYYSDTAPTSSDMASYCSNATKLRTITKNSAGYYGPLTAKGKTDGTIGNLSQRDIYVTFEFNAKSAGGQAIRFSGVQFDVTMTGGSTPSHTSHTYGENYLFSATQHWKKCTGCDITTSPVNHTITYNTTSTTHSEKCNICGDTGSAVSHTYNNGVCVCGATNSTEPKVVSLKYTYNINNTVSGLVQKLPNGAFGDKAYRFSELNGKSYNRGVTPNFTTAQASDIGAYAVKNIMLDKNGTNSYLTPFVNEAWANSGSGYIVYKLNACDGKKFTGGSVDLYGNSLSSGGTSRKIYAYAMTTDPTQNGYDMSGATLIASYVKEVGQTGTYDFRTSPLSGNASISGNDIYIVVKIDRATGTSNYLDLCGGTSYLSKLNSDAVGIRLEGVSITASTEDYDHTHSMTPTTAKTATCAAAGNTAYWYCSGCKKYFSDENGNTEITLASAVIPATGVHNYVNGICSSCGAIDSPEPQSDTIIWNFDRNQTITDASEPSWLDTTTNPLTTNKYTASTKPLVDYIEFDLFSASDIGAYAVYNLWFDVATANSSQLNAGGNGHSYINPFYYQHWANDDATSSTALNDNYKSYIIYKVTPSSGAVLDKVSVKLKGYARNGAGKEVNVYVTTIDPGQSSAPAVSVMTALKTFTNGGTQLAYGTWSNAVDINLTNATEAYVIIELHCVSGNATSAMMTGNCYSKWSVGGVINPLISAIEIDRTQHVTNTNDYFA